MGVTREMYAKGKRKGPGCWIMGIWENPLLMGESSPRERRGRASFEMLLWENGGQGARLGEGGRRG